MDDLEKERRIKWANQVMETYPFIRDFITEFQTKTMYGKFTRVDFSLKDFGPEYKQVEFRFSLIIEFGNGKVLQKIVIGLNRIINFQVLESAQFRDCEHNGIEYELSKSIKKLITETYLEIIHFTVNKENVRLV